MHKPILRILSGMFVVVALLLLTLIPASAGERLLTVNSSVGNDVWTITGEPTLVMNGFDLTPLEILRPAVIDKVTIAVDAPVVGQQSEIVIYQDVNGGSPVDAQLVHREAVNIISAGSVTLTLTEPATITAPVVWVGFYLPVDFRFLADTSGSSVLTYWAWTEGGTFDLANLASAGVFGPSDGSAPVNLDLGGKARITAEITGADPQAGTPVVLQGFQTAGSQDVNLGVLAQYSTCQGIQWDTEDELISYENRVNLHCRPLETWHAPPSPQGFDRRGQLYDITVFSNEGLVNNVFEAFVTHCITPDEGDRDRVVIGVAYGAPRVWRILPTQRFGDSIVCAELPHVGHVAYFVPVTTSETSTTTDAMTDEMTDAMRDEAGAGAS